MAEAPISKRKLLEKLMLVARQLKLQFDRDMSEFGVTRARWTLIAVVSRHPGSTQRMIAEALGITEASAGRLIDRLCEEGLLERRPKDSDRRAHSIYLTKAAGSVLSTLEDAARRQEKKAFATFSEAEIDKFFRLLERIHGNIADGE